MDLYAKDAGAIQSGNMRTQAQQRLGEAISMHNSELAGQLKLEKGQLAQQQTEQAIQGIMSGYMDVRGFQNGLKEYKTWSQARANKASALKDLTSGPAQQGEVRVGDENTPPEVEARPNTTSEPNPTATPEGSPAQGTADVNPSAEEHTAITAGKQGEGESGSLLQKGMSKIGLTEEGVEKLGKGVGALGSAAVAGIDIYQDIKKGKLGDNGWEDVGQVGQIGGAIADTVGAVFPPAALVGAGLSLVGGIFDDIGEAIESSKKKKEAQEAQEQQQEQTVAPPVVQQAQVAAAPRAVS
tara:strand:+ start:669 stop:1559 length:891 start_codon:yes stop_codon:yes gene_type:complete